MAEVDLDAARLTVNQQVVSVEYELIEDDLKTASSRRTIDLDEQTIVMLRRHRRGQLEERMATGQRDGDDFVFARPDGSPVHPDLISQTFQRFMDQSELPRIRLHDLRHTHATILLQQNVHPKVVSERLGHSSIALHHDRLPTRHARHAGLGRRNVPAPLCSAAPHSTFAAVADQDVLRREYVLTSVDLEHTLQTRLSTSLSRSE